MTADGWVREVPCKGAGDRDRVIQLLINTANEIVLIAPPGEAGRLTLSNLVMLKNVLVEAQHELVARGVELQ